MITVGPQWQQMVESKSLRDELDFTENDGPILLLKTTALLYYQIIYKYYHYIMYAGCVTSLNYRSPRVTYMLYCYVYTRLL